MSLQPLVENAVRHGALAVRGSGRVQLTGVVVAPPGEGEDGDAVLELRVFDDGPGAPPDRDPRTSGTGLSATARRIALLYGARGSLSATNVAGGGFEVVLRLPAALRRRRVAGDDAGASGRRGARAERAGSAHPAVS
jgi:LytS/YehU family sensor histidine kinase